MQTKHTIAPNILTNGTCYNAELQVFNKENIASSMSNRIVFYCYTTPVLRFTNIVENQIIRSSSYIPTLEYTQNEGELLNEYQVILYDIHHTQVYQTGILYTLENMKAHISNLSDNAKYYLRAVGKTLNGMDVDSGYIPISVEYIHPSLYAIVSLENNPVKKHIKIQSNIIPIEGIITPEPAIYINEKAIDLTADGTNVVFNDGFCIEDNFTLEYKDCGFKNTQCLLLLTEGNKKIELFYREGKFSGDINQKAYTWLKVTDRTTIYISASELIDIPLPTELLHIWIRRINNLYDVKMTNTKEVV